MRRTERGLAAVAAAIFVAAASTVGVQVTTVPTEPLPAVWFGHPELAERFDTRAVVSSVSWARGEPSSAIYEVGDGQLTIETLRLDDELPGDHVIGHRTTALLMGVPDEHAHARDLAFAAGPEAFERFERELLEQLRREDPVRGEILADLSVGCLRLVVGGHGLPSVTTDVLRDLTYELEDRVRAVVATEPSPCAAWGGVP